MGWWWRSWWGGAEGCEPKGTGGQGSRVSPLFPPPRWLVLMHRNSGDNFSPGTLQLPEQQCACVCRRQGSPAGKQNLTKAHPEGGKEQGRSPGWVSREGGARQQESRDRVL